MSAWVALAVMAGVAGARPAVDRAAMQEAMQGQGSTQFPAAAAYAHFLRARLAHEGGRPSLAIDELRLALATDESSAYLRRALAQEHALLGHAEEAERLLSEVVVRAPDDARAQLQLGRALADADKVKKAKVAMERAIRLAPASADGYLALAELALRHGETPEAMRVIDRLGRARPGDPVGYRWLGLALAERGDAPRAQRLLERVVERDRDDLESWATLARLFEATGAADRALGAWGRAVERAPENEEVLLGAARAALRMGQPDRARQWFDRLLSEQQDAETVAKVAFGYLSANRAQEAAAVLERARASSREPRLQFYAGLVSERLRRYEAAADAFARVGTDVGELYFEAQLHRAACLSSSGAHAAALQSFRRLEAERPHLPGLDASLGRALERSGQVDAAEDRLVRAYEARPTRELAQVLTNFYERRGRLPAAVQLFRGTAGRRPDDPSVRLSLAAALDRSGDWRGALRVLQEDVARQPDAARFVGATLAAHGASLEEAQRVVLRALVRHPDDGALLDALGWVCFRRGELRRARAYFERALQTAPDQASVLEHLGDVLAKQGRASEAAGAFSRALEIVSTAPEDSERPAQRAALERKLKLLSSGRLVH